MAYEKLLSSIKFDERGLIPAIAQQFDSGEILMMAWMNAESLAETLNTRRVCYWSRSRETLWFKGETSGQTQSLKELIADCDYDTLLLKVDQLGVACHTGRRSCFFNAVSDGSFVTIKEQIVDPSELYQT
jgi:phosphoribosyl-AMP cyclohydrolase